MGDPVIFVVDDDASVRNALRRLLFSLHLPVRLFASAEQFLSQVTHGASGCLILDLGLGGMSGLELQERLHSTGWNLPVIVVTSRDDAASKDAAMRLGATAYLRKPFDRTELINGVQAAVTAQH